MKNEIIIRPIQLSDAASVLEIYKPFIEKTNITFECTVPEFNEWEQRIELISRKFPWLVAEFNGEIVGYAYATKHRERIAYSWCCESSVYVSDSFQGKGIAKVLYEKLFQVLRLQGFENVYAILTSPNLKSEKFHESFGFTDVGRFYKAGFKLGNWHNTRWMELHLNHHPIPPSEIIPFDQIKNSKELEWILELP